MAFRGKGGSGLAHRKNLTTSLERKLKRSAQFNCYPSMLSLPSIVSPVRDQRQHDCHLYSYLPDILLV
jgi:hypothetical protein